MTKSAIDLMVEYLDSSASIGASRSENIRIAKRLQAEEKSKPAPVEDYVFIPVDLPDMTASGIVMLSDGTKTDWEDIELYAKVRRNR